MSSGRLDNWQDTRSMLGLDRTRRVWLLALRARVPSQRSSSRRELITPGQRRVRRLRLTPSSDDRRTNT